MSIKKLFDSTNKPRNYLSDTTQQDAFKDVESSRNAIALQEKQTTYVPHLDYTKPEQFAKYGSAYLYYKSAIEFIHDYYPYDGSDAEINEYYNKLLDIEKYIFNNLYPRTNGYILLSAEGWGSATTTVGGYGLSNTEEYITLYGGPGTGSAYTNLSEAFEDPHSSKYKSSNIYSTDIYTEAGLPTSYGEGTRTSNLRSNFDTGVTVEFWLQKDAFTAQTRREVILDVWNNELSSSDDYGRIPISVYFFRIASDFPESKFIQGTAKFAITCP